MLRPISGRPSCTRMRSEPFAPRPPDSWPALMDRRTVAAFLGMSPRSAVRLLTREGVEPVRLGLRLRRWRRADLEGMAARLATAGDRVADETEAALARVAR